MCLWLSGWGKDMKLITFKALRFSFTPPYSKYELRSAEGQEWKDSFFMQEMKDSACSAETRALCSVTLCSSNHPAAVHKSNKEDSRTVEKSSKKADTTLSWKRRKIKDYQKKIWHVGDVGYITISETNLEQETGLTVSKNQGQSNAMIRCLNGPKSDQMTMTVVEPGNNVIKLLF